MDTEATVDNTTDGTVQDPMTSDDPIYATYTSLDFVIGLAITLGASTLQALGLNLTKLDHQRNERIPKSQRKPDYMRVRLASSALSSYTHSRY